MIEIQDFTVSSRDMTWTVETMWDSRVRQQKHTFWTLTIHTASCVYATENRLGRAYTGDSSRGMEALAEHGLGIEKWAHRCVFRGCKRCGTASIPQSEWKAAARAEREKQKDEQRRSQEELALYYRKRDAAKEYAKVQQDAAAALVETWVAERQEELDAARASAAARWIAENPDVPSEWLQSVV